MKKLLILLLAAVILCGCCANTSNDPLPEDTTEMLDPNDPEVFHGRIVVDGSANFTHPDITTPDDLSGIEIEVYYGKRIGGGNYGFNYDHSVYTDKDGAFSFQKPSEHFSYQIKLSSLPKGYGAIGGPNRCTPENSMEEGVITISAIAKIDAEFTGIGRGVNSVTILNGANRSMFADYTVTKDSVAPLEYEALVSLNDLVYTGTITASQVDFEYTAPLDISKMDLLGKIELLYELGGIDEAKKIEYYCYAFNDSRANIYCGTSILAQIQAYKHAHANEELSASLQNAIDSVLNHLGH